VNFVTSYGTECYYESLDILGESSIGIGGADEFVKYTYDDLKDSAFFIENKSIIERPMVSKQVSAHYWIWKPYIILETMKRCADGDIVLYLDAGMKVISSLDPLFKITNENKCMIFSVSKTPEALHYHSMYTKRDCFILMGLDEPVYWNTRCVNAAISIWMKNEKNIALLTEWQNYVTDSRIVTDDENTCGLSNLPDFKYHLYDQSVLSLLCTKYSKEVYRDPSQYSINEKQDFPNSPYNQLVVQHNIHLYTQYESINIGFKWSDRKAADKILEIK
jgi:hypothetical protein